MYIFNLPMIKCIGVAFWGNKILAEPPRSRFFRRWSRLEAVFMLGAGAGAVGRSRSRREPVGAGAAKTGRLRNTAVLCSHVFLKIKISVAK